jgi:hypothetical protein
MFKVSRATFYRYMDDGAAANGTAPPVGEEVRDR